MRGPFRVLDLGGVGGLRSQSVYHALCGSVGQGGPNTVAVLHPREAYVCIGYHRDLRTDVDVAYCARRGLPVYRRQTGGGAVLIDGDQLFFQVVVAERDAPRAVAHGYAEGLRPLVETYRALGLDARLTDVNDISVGGRKISGTAMASIDGAVVVTGNILFDFDAGTMARLLNLPDAAMRLEVERGMRTHLTTLRRELGEGVCRRQVKQILLEQVARAFGDGCVEGALTADEAERVRRVERRFLSPAWLNRFSGTGAPARRVKIKGGVYVCDVRAAGDVPVRCVVAVADGRIGALRLLDGFSVSSGGLEALERALTGGVLRREALLEAVHRAYRDTGVEIRGAGPEVLADLLLQAAADSAAAA